MAEQADSSESSPFYYRPLIPLLFAFASGLALCRMEPGHISAAAGAGTAAALAAFLNLAMKKPARISPLLLYLAIGYLSLAPWHSAPADSNHLLNFAGNKTWKITGRVQDRPVRSSFRTSLVLSDVCLAEKTGPGSPFQVRGKLRATLYGSSRRILPGDRVSFSGRIKPFHNFNNPGGFDYKSFMAYRNIRARTYASAGSIRIEHSPGRNHAVSFIRSARSSASGLIERSLKGDCRSLLKALVLGRRESLPDKLEKAFNRSGASHILAISGLHIGIVATVSFFIIKSLLNFFPGLVCRGRPAKLAAAFSILPVLLYAAMAGMSPSTQRAVIMVGVFLFSLVIEREHDLINTLAAAALAILIVNPPGLFSISFQLSFAAVFTIILGMSALRQGPRITSIPAAKILFSFTAVSFFAIIGTTPLIMHYFNQVSFLGILTNLLVVPVIGFFVVPVSLFSVLALNPVHDVLAVLGLKAAGAAAGLVLPVIRGIGAWEPAAAKTVTPSLLELACVYTLLYCIIFILKNKNKGGAGPGKRAAALAAAAAVLVLTADACWWCLDRFWNRGLTATVIDVGQGSSCLLELPRGCNMLVDGGGFTDNEIFDVGKNIVAPFLWENKIASVDAVVLSHPDADHLNGLIYILRHFKVKKVLSTGQPSESSGYADFIRTIKEKGIKHPLFRNIPRRFEINGVKFLILHPPACFSGAGGSGTNNSSLVLKASYKGKSILLPGDIMEEAEKELAERHGSNLSARVLVSPHHGSRTSSTRVFLDAVKPSTVVVSAGIENRFHLPAPEVIERYRKRKYRVFTTNSNGAVEISFKGKGDGLEITPFKGCATVIE